MPVSGSGDVYSPNRRKKKNKRKRGPRGQVLRPIRPTLTPVRPTLEPNSALGTPVSNKPGSVKPAAPKAPVQPLDPELENQKIIGQREIATSDLYAGWQQANLDAQYGFGAGGAMSPYSEAAKLQENYKRDVLGTTSGFGQAGQFNSGAYGSAQNENARNYDMRYDAARRAYDQASGNLKFGQLQTYARAGAGIDEATFNAMLKALGGL